MSAKRGNWFRSRLAGSVWQDAAHEILLDLDAEGMSHLLSDSHAAECGLRRFISPMAAMRSGDGPFGPGLRQCDKDENRRRYFRSTNALWNLNSVAGLMSAPSFGIRRELTNNVVRPSTTRSRVVRFVARRRERLLMSS